MSLVYAFNIITLPDAVEQRGRSLTPEQDALEHIKACRDKPFLEEMFIDPSKGFYLIYLVSLRCRFPFKERPVHINKHIHSKHKNRYRNYYDY